MSSLASGGPAPRLLCQACRRATFWQSLPTASVSFDAREPQWKRDYSTKRIKPATSKPISRTPPKSAPASLTPSTAASSRGPRLSARGEVPKEPARYLFSLQDVPTLPEWTVSLEGLGNTHLTALECLDGANRYVSIATQHESEWRDQLEKKAKLPPHLLHWLGVCLLTANTAPRWRLGTHMLRSASELGYTPSTLTLVRTFRSMPPAMFEEKGRHTKMYRAADARFRALVEEGTDPDALTLWGTMEVKNDSNPMRALVVFRQATNAWKKANPALAATTEQKTAAQRDATDASSEPYITLPPPREPRWEWEVTSVLGQADILKKLGRDQEAVDLYRVAALELDNAHAFLELAMLMGGSPRSPERRTYLLKAAISGLPEACRAMGQVEALDAQDESLSQKQRAQHKLLSQEWFRLGSGAEMESIKEEDISDVEQ